MPLLAVLHIAVAIFFAVHAVRTGRNTVWLFVLLSFPFVGSLVYLFAEYLPEKRHSRVVRNTGAAFKQLLEPQRELREAQAALEQTPSMGNRLRLAHALLAAGRPADALPHFEACAQGIFATDPEVLRGVALTQQSLGNADAAWQTVNKLLNQYPQRQTGELALLYAQLAAQAAPEQAEAAFGVALRSHGGIATHSAWGQWLLAQGRSGEARPVLQQVAKDGRLATAHSRELNREAIEGAAAALQRLND